MHGHIYDKKYNALCWTIDLIPSNIYQYNKMLNKTNL